MQLLYNTLIDLGVGDNKIFTDIAEKQKLTHNFSCRNGACIS